MKDPFEELEVDPRRVALITAIVVVGALILATVGTTTLATVGVILALFAMILLHELGHFLTAKRAGMKVTEFFVGFGPRLYSFRRGETEYGVKAFPLGGYCKIIGMTNLEDVAPEDEERAYRSKGYLARFSVAGAGSATHFLVAIVLMFAVLLGAGNLREAEPTTTLRVIAPDSPAEQAGLREGDRLIAIDGVAVDVWDGVSEAIAERPGETVPFVVEREGRVRTFEVRLDRQNPSGETRGFAGVSPTVDVPQPGLFESAVHAPREVALVAKDSIVALGDIFSLSGIRDYFRNVAGEEDAPEDARFVSPVGFGRLANQAVTAGWVETLGLLLAINVFIGIFNLVPLLPFDGGHIAIATYEKIASLVRHRRVQVDVAKLLPLTVAVVALLGFIFLSALFLDLTNPISNPF